MRYRNLGIFTLGTLLSVTALAAEIHSDGHPDGHHEDEHHEADAHHHGPDAWNAPLEAAKRPNPIPADAASLARGKHIFARDCANCHGPTGQGDGPRAASLNPKPANLQVMGKMHSPGDLAWKIAEGRGPMPAWKETLSARQIWDTVNYIQQLAQAKLPSDTQMDHRADHPMPMDQDSGGHAGHQMPMDQDAGDHAGHVMAPPATTGPWSYHGRDNPKPYRNNRWEMIPVPGYGHMYLSAQDISQELRCAAILNNPRFMVDHQTRTACGQTPPAPASPPPAHGGHDHH